MSWEAQDQKAEAQVTTCKKIAQDLILPLYEKGLLIFSNPFSPRLMAWYIAHEATRYNRKKKAWEVLRHLVTNYPEIGLTNLTAKRGDNEVEKYGKDPFHPLSHIWMAQRAFYDLECRLKDTLVNSPSFQGKLLRDYKVLLALWCRAIGIGCARGLLRKGARINPEDAVQGALMWIKRDEADTSRFDGAQGTETVRLRVAWTYRMFGSLSSLERLFPRPNTDDDNPLLRPLPRDFWAPGRLEAYAAKARREGPAPIVL